MFQYIKQSKQQLALDMWAQAIKLKPCHLAAWSNMLVLLDTLERYDEVTEKSSIALKTCPPSPAIHFTLANTLGKLKRWTEAEKHFKEAVKLNPRNALYYSNFGNKYIIILF